MTDPGSITIGLVGAGAMGSALGANWIAGGHAVRTCLSGRTSRTRELVEAAGIEMLDAFDDVVRSDVVVSVVPPAQAVAAARAIAEAAARTGATPVVADLNAVSPQTLDEIARELGSLVLVDGSISGGPPRPDRRTLVYLSGPDADRIAAPAAPWLDVVVLPGGLGAASALKMCTASMYKGSSALRAQAMLTARHFGVLEPFLADVSRQWPDDVPRWSAGVALAATKARRYVGEMHEIAATQRSAGTSGALFDGIADVYRRLAISPLGARPPESVDGAEALTHVLDQLVTSTPRAVLFDFSGTLFHVETAEQALLAALGADFVEHAGELRRWGAINGSSTPDELPGELREVWERRDLSADDHRAAYAGLSRHAGLTPEQSDAVYERGVAPEAWTPFRETLPMLRRLHGDGVPVAVVSNIGWDPRPVLELYGADPYVDVLVLSYERGVQKPDPAIFALACAELGVEPGETVMIGDNPDADGAAVAIGCEFVQVPADPAERRGNEFALALRAGR